VKLAQPVVVRSKFPRWSPPCVNGFGTPLVAAFGMALDLSSYALEV
jgi:hypothetical protein